MTENRASENRSKPFQSNNSETVSERETEIVDALINNHDQVRVRELLDGDPALVCLHDERGETLLHKAAYDPGQEEMVRLLIQKGADVNARNNYGETPLHYASQYGVLTSLPILIASNANLESRDRNGRTPLMNAAVKWWEKPGIAEFLLKNGAKLDLWSAFWLQDYGAVREILKKNPKAVEEHSLAGDLIQLALNSIAHHNAPNDLLELLLAHGADPNLQDSQGDHPLYVASRMSELPIKLVKVLLDFGADPNAKTCSNRYLVAEMKRRGRSDVVDLLRAYGAKQSGKES